MDGLILVDKPRGLTSHDVVARIRRCLRVQKAGHFGTLDPLATGLLLVAVGRAVKLFPLFSNQDKLYTGEIRLGVATDTYDALGQPAASETNVLPVREAVVEAMSRLTGEILQAPPPYSAKKLAGKPLYKWARSHQAVACPPRPVRVVRFELTDYRPPVIAFEVHCGSGTYVRSLAHELGEMLGCGAHLAALRRVSAGDLSVAQASTLERFETLAAEGRTDEAVLPLESLLPGIPRLILTETGEGRLQKGRPLTAGDFQGQPPVSAPGETPAIAGRQVCRLFSLKGRFLGLAEAGPAPDTFLPFLLFPS